MKRAIAILAFLFGILGASAAIALEDGPPPLPAWRNADGTLNPAEMPAMMPVAGPNGAIVGYASSAKLFGPPPAMVMGPNGDMVPGEEQPISVVTLDGKLVGHVESGTFVPSP